MHAHVLALTSLNQRRPVVSKLLVLNHEQVSRGHHGSEWMQIQRREVGRRRLPTVTGDAEISNQTLGMGIEERFHGSTRREARVQIGPGADRVELVEVELIAAESINRAQQLFAGIRAVPLLRLATDKDIRQRISLEVFTQPHLSVRITWSDIYLIDASRHGGIYQRVGA